MERIRGFKAKRAVRPNEEENSAGGDINPTTDAVKTKKREQYEKKLKMDKSELEQRYIELQAKLDDTEAFWKDDSRHKDRKILELERTNKSLLDSNSFLNIKMKMLEQELADKQEQVDVLKQQVEKLDKQSRQAAVKYSNKFY